MKINVSVTDNFKIDLKNKSFVLELKKLLFNTAIQVQNEARTLVQTGTRSGRAYVRRSQDSPRIYVDKVKRPETIAGLPKTIASAKGEPPKTDTGRLVNTINIDGSVKEDGGGSPYVIIKAGGGAVNYAAKLEDELNRPYMTPASKKGLDFFKKNINNIVKRAYDSK
jgi:hypothetical protein